jgi:hypothetical protein
MPPCTEHRRAGHRTWLMSKIMQDRPFVHYPGPSHGPMPGGDFVQRAVPTTIQRASEGDCPTVFDCDLASIQKRGASL